MTNERTFIAIKPDGVQRGLIAKIIGRFEKRGYKLVAMKFMTASKQHLEVHYAEHKDRSFFAGLVNYMASGPVCAMVWEGKDVIKQARKMLGATNPLNSEIGTIRGDYALDLEHNICHGSDGLESAEREIGHWFKPEELVQWNSCSQAWA